MPTLLHDQSIKVDQYHLICSRSYSQPMHFYKLTRSYLLLFIMLLTISPKWSSNYYPSLLCYPHLNKYNIISTPNLTSPSKPSPSQLKYPSCSF